MPAATLLEAINYFADEARCIAFVAEQRWPDGNAICPQCGRNDASFVPSRKVWQCKSRHPKRTFSVKVGTIFEDSPIPLSKWLPATWLLASAKNGISSYELSKAVGVTQKSAWFMLHRIRFAMQSGGFDQMDGQVEVDETYVGGRSEFMHKARRAAKIQSTGPKGKTAVFGLLERHGPDGHSRVRAEVVSRTTRKVLTGEIRHNVAEGSDLFSDAHPSYWGLNEFAHETINHAEEYVCGKVHTNGIENFWSLLKRALKGTYVSVEPFHLDAYIDEEVFRFNTRKQTDATRMTQVIGQVTGRRLTYTDLTGGVA